MRRHLWLFFAPVVLLTLGCSTRVKLPEMEVDLAQAEKAWALVLEKYVDQEGWVDFEGLKANPENLNRFLAFVRKYGPENRMDLFSDPKAALAFHINAYNALSMFGVLEAGIPQTNAGFAKVKFFVFKKYEIAGKFRSLKDYEDHVIRKIGDPRIHFALNCMAVACPKLPKVAFQGKILDQQLDQGSRYFFSESRNLKVDHSKKEVWATEILKFFPEDFLAVESSILSYINLWAPEKIPADYKVRYIPYDWSIINKANKPKN